MKLKPVEKYELENIAKADTFLAYDCAHANRKPRVLDGGFLEAKMLIEKQKGDHTMRLLIYAVDMVAENSGALSRHILLDSRNIVLYETWLKYKELQSA